MQMGGATAALAEQWHEELDQLMSGLAHDPTRELRLKAVDGLRRYGLPGRKSEHWKYTPLRRLETLMPSLLTASSGNNEFTQPLFEAGSRLDAADGLFEPSGSLPDGVRFTPPDSSWSEYADVLGKCVEQQIAGDDANQAFARLHSAAGPGIAVLHVDRGVDAGSVLLRYQTGAGGLSQPGLVVILEADARLQLLEQMDASGSQGTALNGMLHFQLGQSATLDHLRVQTTGEADIVLTQTSAEQQAHSHYHYTGIDVGFGLARHSIRVELAGEGADCQLNGAFALDQSGHADNHIFVDHAAGGCTSRQFFRGVLAGKSRGVWNGKALIRPGADDSSVEQSNANLLLSRNAEIDTKPELEIYADEVVASHGATVGQLDESAVFYLRTRGLDDNRARRMLTRAFCHAAVSHLGESELATQVSKILDQAMPMSSDNKG